ncbi:MAG: SOS response-associated peptidase [Clostridiales bacterium]|nr:SOS response-associated peptidase [Clostridiales bacterium]
MVRIIEIKIRGVLVAFDTDPAPVITGNRNALKEKNRFSRMDGRVLYMAGFFDLMENEERFVILTTGANESMTMVHDRMPLVLEEAQISDWILDDSSTEELLCQVPGDLKRQTDFEQMTLFVN